MNDLVIDAIRKAVVGSTFAPDLSSRSPAVPVCTSTPSTTMPQASPGVSPASTGLVKARSTAS